MSKGFLLFRLCGLVFKEVSNFQSIFCVNEHTIGSACCSAGGVFNKQCAKSLAQRIRPQKLLLPPNNNKISRLSAASTLRVTFRLEAVKNLLVL